ncbi:MAG: hypothetical protein AVDCRST_MAG86-3064 [uncultured Truepera sp.]|uniref:DUF4145 domain-containing protein n=1 Tax=uncultured Truepera sp. TaxID=543023 RepID=A0A6J4VR75_9DEIN|nr:MAG: hypothetical protein AVDCRST_MAG86-3064 [uncultured Truepera sp.]
MSCTNTKLDELLNPDLLRARLISASLYLAAYELLENSIVERIKIFLVIGFEVDNSADLATYRDEVLSRNKSPIYASLSWLLEQNAITKGDLKKYEAIKNCRNVVAHEMTSVIVGEVKTDYLEQFPIMIALLKKIETWWILNVDVPTNPEFDGVNVTEVDIMPGPVIVLQLLLNIALEEPETTN